jgi:hypothetical protein
MGSRRVNLPSVAVATVPQRAMQRLQYPWTCLTFGVSGDMHNSVAAMESCVWPDHVYRNRADCQVNITRPPSNYLPEGQESKIK